MDQIFPSLRKDFQNISKENPNFSKLFQGNSKHIPWRFPAKSTGWRRRRAISAFSKLPRLNSPQLGRRSTSDRPPRSTRKPAPKFNCKLPSFPFFRKDNVAAVGRATRTISRSGERLSATSAKAPRRPRARSIGAKAVTSPNWPLSKRPPQFAVDLLIAKIPIWAVKGARSAPPAAVETLDSPFQSEKGLVKRSTANCGGRGGRRAASQRECAFPDFARRT